MKKLSSTQEEAALSFNKSVFFPEKPTGFTVNSVAPAPAPVHKLQEEKQAAYEKGKLEASTHYNQEIRKLRDEYALRQEELLKGLHEKVENVLQELDSRLPSLVVSISEKIIGGISLDAEMIQSMVKAMIDESGSSEENLEVFLCPNDLNLLKSFADKDKEPEKSDNEEGFASAIAGIFDGIDGDDALLEGYPNVKFFEDASLGAGDCQVKSRFGLLDGRIATKLRRVEEEIKGD